MTTAPKTIDVWDVQTFDPELTSWLEAHAGLVCSYLEMDDKIFLSHDYGHNSGSSMLRPSNPHASEYQRFLEMIGERIGSRTIRAFHYTRLMNDEVATLLKDGIHVSTPQTLRQRLDALVASDSLTPAMADRLYEKSPFHSDQLEARSDKFWMTSHPVPVNDGGVEPLMKYWGGEVASMWIRDAAPSQHLAKLGAPRIIEVVVPLKATEHAYCAGKAVVAAYARSRGAIPGKFAFDLYVRQALPPTAVLAVHTAGDAVFDAMGQSYPLGYVDVDIGRWKELTGEKH